MKIAVILAALSFTYVAAHRHCLIGRAIREGFETCRDTLNPDEETLQLVLVEGGLDDEKANCLRACALKEAGLLNDAKLDFERVRELMNLGPFARPERADRMIEEVKKCQQDAEESGDECTVAGKYAKCIYDLKPPRRQFDKGDRPDE